MARITSSEIVECGDGFRSTTVYDSEWCEHKENKNYCRKCNIIKEKHYRLSRRDLRKLLNIPRDFEIISVDGEGFPVRNGISIYTRKTRRRK